MEGKRDGKWNNIIRKGDGWGGSDSIRRGARKKCELENESDEAIAVASYRSLWRVVLVSNYSRSSGEAARAMTGAVSPAATPLQFLHFAFYSFCHSLSVSLEKK